MRVTFIFFAVMSLLVMVGLSVNAQERANTTDALDQLHLQLIEIQEKEGSLRVRAQQLEEQLKPENIERALAGIGSTRPEDLREALRRRLTIELETVRAQLKIVEMTRTHVERSIASAEGRAYQESALPMPSPPVNALRVDSIAFSPAFAAILVLSLVLSFATVIFTVKGLNR
jgi:hypothetical protein